MLNEMEKQEIRDHATRWEKGSGFGTIDGRRSPEMIVAQLRGYEFMGCTNGQQYVFSSQPECVFNDSCLKDVLDFMVRVKP